MSPAAPPPTPTVIARRYELQRQLAQGGMAEVWLAVDLTLDRKVAVKWLKPTLASDEVVAERFRREADRRGQPQPPEHRRRPRRVRTGRSPGRRDATRRGQEPAPAARHPEAAEPRTHLSHRHLRRVRARPRPRGRLRASRRQAGQHHDHLRRARPADRLRHRQGPAVGRRRPHERQHHDGHGQVPVARSRCAARSSTDAPTCTRSASCSTNVSPGAFRSSARPTPTPRSPASSATRPISPGCEPRCRLRSSPSSTSCSPATRRAAPPPAPNSSRRCVRPGQGGPAGRSTRRPPSAHRSCPFGTKRFRRAPSDELERPRPEPRAPAAASRWPRAKSTPAKTHSNSAQPTGIRSTGIHSTGSDHRHQPDHDEPDHRQPGHGVAHDIDGRRHSGRVTRTGSVPVTDGHDGRRATVGAGAPGTPADTATGHPARRPGRPRTACRTAGSRACSSSPSCSWSPSLVGALLWFNLQYGGGDVVPPPPPGCRRADAVAPTDPLTGAAPPIRPPTRSARRRRAGDHRHHHDVRPRRRQRGERRRHRAARWPTATPPRRGRP